MGRRKKDAELNPELESVESLEPENEDNEVAEEILEADAEETAEETPVEATEEIEEEKPAPKPKPRKRAAPRRRKKADTVNQLLDAASEAVVETDTEPKAAELVPSNALTQTPIEAKAWESVNDISLSISNHLERVSKMLQEIPTQYSGALNELIKSPPPKPSFVSKLAMGLSSFAILLSMISLTLSQSVRTKFIAQENAVMTSDKPQQALALPQTNESAKHLKIARRTNKK